MAPYSAAAAASNIVELPRTQRLNAPWRPVGFRHDGWSYQPDGSRINDDDFFARGPVAHHPSGLVLRLESAVPEDIERAGVREMPAGHVCLRIAQRHRNNEVSVALAIVPGEAAPVINAATNAFGDCLSLRAISNAIQDERQDGCDAFLLKPALCFRYLGRGRWAERHLKGRVCDSSYAFYSAKVPALSFGDRVHALKLTTADIALLPRREWLAERALKRGLVSQIIAPGSAGKSLLTLQWAVAVALGRGDFTGLTVRERTRVLIVNLEDDLAEQRLRLAAVAIQFGISLEELHGWLHIYNPGEESAFRIAKRTDKRIVESEAVEEILEFASAHEIGFIIFDPLVEMNEADENNNTEMGAVMSVFKKVARTANAAVLFVHHTRKLDRAASDGHAGNVDSGRGASSIPNATRITITLYNMSGSEAKALGIPDLERNRYVRLDDAKANQFLASGQAKWFKRTSVDLPNGEQVGVLVPSNLGANNRTAQCQLLASRIMVAALEAGRKLSPSTKAGNSAAAYCVENQGESDFTKAEFAKALAAISGFDFDIEDYASGGKTAERYVLVGQAGRFADGSGSDG